MSIYVIIIDFLFLDFLRGKLFQDSVSIHYINSSVTTVTSSEMLDKNAYYYAKSKGGWYKKVFSEKVYVK